MNEKEKDALIQVKHFNNITRYWQEEEYEEKEIKKYITTILNLIEKQDKIINEMAEFIEDEMTVDEFCKEKNCYADEYINGHCQKCLKCIIKFYSKKVGE